MRVRVVRSARKHRIGNAHIVAAMANAGEPVVTENERGPVLSYVGVDDRGVELHIVAVLDDRDPTGLAVIHAMPTSFTEDSSEDATDGNADEQGTKEGES